VDYYRSALLNRGASESTWNLADAIAKWAIDNSVDLLWYYPEKMGYEFVGVFGKHTTAEIWRAFTLLRKTGMAALVERTRPQTRIRLFL